MNRLILLAFLGIALSGCVDTDSLRETDPDAVRQFRTKIFNLEAPCKVNVEGFGEIDTEEDYLPGVVSCENPNAPEEALKAQAVQARTFFYYKKFVEGQEVIRNSQADQVYRCDHAPNGPSAAHIKAVEDTRGQYLQWNNSIIAAFYVAGAIPPNPDANNPFTSCMGNGGNDPTNTQRWVTYNRGKTNCDVEMTPLGFTTDDCFAFPVNRGCASQNGESCLAQIGVDYTQMFPFHYGDDIVLDVADGICGGTPMVGDEFDAFCEANDDGSHCLNAVSRIECAGGMSDLVEDCPNGCGEGACLTEVEDSFCAGQADDVYCDGAQRVECLDQMVALTEACPDGCEEGACIGDTIVDREKDEDGGIPGTSDEEGSLVTTSPGLDGGCRTAPSPTDSLGWLLTMVGWFILRRRKE